MKTYHNKHTKTIATVFHKYAESTVEVTFKISSFKEFKAIQHDCRKYKHSLAAGGLDSGLGLYVISQKELTADDLELIFQDLTNKENWDVL